MKTSTVAACVKNDSGDLLTYTTQSSIHRVEEFCNEFFGEETWKKLQELGCKIVQVEIKEI